MSEIDEVLSSRGWTRIPGQKDVIRLTRTFEED